MVEFMGHQISFCIPVSHEQALMAIEWFEEKKMNNLVGILLDTGAAIPDGAKFIIDMGEADKPSQCWFATSDCLERGPDEVFVMLKTPNNKDTTPLPSFSDVFKMVEIKPTDSEQVTNEKLKEAFGE